MKNLQVTEDAVRKAYTDGSKEVKAMLEKLHGKEVFAQNITERVKSYEDACEVVGMDSSIKGLETFRKDITAYCMLTTIAEALNEDWKPDWSNSSEPKYYPYFTMKSGFGLSYYDYGRWTASTSAGSRLCYRTRELAEYAGKQFEAIYRDFLTF